MECRRVTLPLWPLSFVGVSLVVDVTFSSCVWVELCDIVSLASSPNDSSLPPSWLSESTSEGASCLSEPASLCPLDECNAWMLTTLLYCILYRATITLYPIRRPVRAIITLYPIGRPVRVTITLSYRETCWSYYYTVSYRETH